MALCDVESKERGRIDTHSPHPPSVLINLDTRGKPRGAEPTETGEKTAYAPAQGVYGRILSTFTPGVRPEDRSPLLVDVDDDSDRLELTRETNRRGAGRE